MKIYKILVLIPRRQGKKNSYVSKAVNPAPNAIPTSLDLVSDNDIDTNYSAANLVPIDNTPAAHSVVVGMIILAAPPASLDTV